MIENVEITIKDDVTTDTVLYSFVMVIVLQHRNVLIALLIERI